MVITELKNINFVIKRILCLISIALSYAVPVLAQDTSNTSIAMLNYLATQTRLIGNSNNNRLMLEDIYSKLINNTNPGIVDETTQYFLQIMLDDIERFRITSLQRERLQFILENQRAQAINQAMPNPLYLLGLMGPGGLSTIMRSSSSSMNLSGSLSGSLSGLVGTAAGSVSGNISGSIAKTIAENITKTVTNPMKLIATVSIMTLDSVLKYKSALDDANLDFLKDNWELDDRESAVLHDLRSQTFSYMIDIARRNQLGLFDTLNEESIDNFVNFCLDENLERRRQSLETNRIIYSKYAPYYIELAKTYYDLEMYQECINAIEEYEKIKAPIFRKDFDLASVLPKAIIAAFFVYGFEDEYVNLAEKYLQQLVDNTNSSNWELRYFAAQTYINLAAISNSNTNLLNAYNLLFDNVTFLSKQQEMHLTTYINPVNEKISKGVTKEQEKKIKLTIKELKLLRKTELPPLSDALVINHQTLLLLMDELGISEQNRMRVDAILDKAYINPSLRKQYFNDVYNVEQNSFILKMKSHYTFIEILKIIGFSFIILIIFSVLFFWFFTDFQTRNFLILVFGLPFIIFVSNFFFDFIPIQRLPVLSRPVECNSINISMPAVFLSPNCKVNFKIISDKSYDEFDVKYIIKNVRRNTKNDINSFKAVAFVNLDDIIICRKEQEYDLHILIEANDVSSTLVFKSPVGVKKFSFSSIQ